MLTKEPTQDMINGWKKTYNEYINKIRPNKKTGAQVTEYLMQNYPLIELKDSRFEKIVLDNLGFQNKTVNMSNFNCKVFCIENKGNGKVLYENQDEVFKDISIMVGIELKTAFFYVEGSSFLWDDLFAFRGLDDNDLKNYYLVAEYIECLKKFDRLNMILDQVKHI